MNWSAAAIFAKQAGPYTDADILNFLVNTEVRNLHRQPQGLVWDVIFPSFLAESITAVVKICQQPALVGSGLRDACGRRCVLRCGTFHM